MAVLSLMLALLAQAEVHANFAYVANTGSNTVSVINTVTNTVTATITVGTGPIGVAASLDGSTVFVSNLSTNNVSVINTATNTVVATVAVGASPVGVAINPILGKVYVVNTGSDSVTVFSATAPYGIIATIPVGSGPGFDAFNPVLQRVYVTNFNPPGTISVIDSITDTVIAGEQITVGGGPEGITISPDGAFAYVELANAGVVDIINLSTNNQTPVIVFGIPYNGAINPDGSVLYTTNQTIGSKVSAIQVQSQNHHVTSIPIGPAGTANTSGIALTPDGTRAYISNDGGAGNTVAIVDTSSNTQTGTVTVGLSPMGIAIAPSPSPFPVPPVGISSQVKGFAKANRYLTQTDFYNLIIWSSPGSFTIQKYQIFRNAAKTDLAGQVFVAPEVALQFEDHGLQEDQSYSYFVYGVTQSGISIFLGSTTVVAED